MSRAGNIKKVCTIGPVTNSRPMIEKLVDTGMNVARLNFSHGTHEDHRKVIDILQAVRQARGVNLGILQDLSGPKIRVGDVGQGVVLEDGKHAVLTVDEGSVSSEYTSIPVQYPKLVKDGNVGNRILIDDGLIVLSVVAKRGDGLECRVIHGGTVQSHKGVNFPDQVLSESAPTEDDLQDLTFGLDQGVDMVALSFVQQADDIRRLRRAMEERGRLVPIIAKIERSTALPNLEEIVREADALMVARGDLGVEAELSMIPIYQKQMVRTANYHGKPVITATQMLDSMMRNPRPTRAEVTDVANAIYDGTDAIMLSGETAVGRYPIETLEMMCRISTQVEQNLGLDRSWVREESGYFQYSSETALAAAAVKTAETLDARFIVAPTMTGRTARLLAMHRPAIPIVGITPNRTTYYQLSLVWGVRALHVEGTERDLVETIAKTERALLSLGWVEKGDTVVVTAGIPAFVAGGTNVMKVHQVCEDPV
jgi:pyruvate kinase